MEYLIYSIMVALAILLNWRSTNLWLLLVVASTYYLPVQLITDKYVWYAVCITVDLTVSGLAMYSKCLASKPLFSISVSLCISHFTSLLSKNPDTYFYVANYLEYLQIICFLIFSKGVLGFIKEKVKECLKNYGYKVYQEY